MLHFEIISAPPVGLERIWKVSVHSQKCRKACVNELSGSQRCPGFDSRGLPAFSLSPWLRTGKRAKVLGNLLHISSYRASNIIHTEHWTYSWVEQRAKHCLSALVLFWLRHAYVERYQAFPAIHIRIPGEPGNEASVVTQWQGTGCTSQVSLAAAGLFTSLFCLVAPRKKYFFFLRILFLCVCVIDTCVHILWGDVGTRGGGGNCGLKGFIVYDFS